MPLNEQEAAIYVALLEASSLLFQAVDRALQQDAGITHAQFEILVRLQSAPGGLRMTDLAAQVLVSRSGLTYQATQLEKMGFIERSPDGGDDRAVVARVTDMAKALLDRTLPNHVVLVRRCLFDLLEPGEGEAIASGLGRVALKLRAGRSEA